MTNKKSKINWLLTAMLLVAAMLMPSVASAAIIPFKPSIGDGSSSNPYQISSAEHLYWFAGLVNGTLSGVTKNPAACAKLMDNITVNKSVLKSDGTINSSQVPLFTAWTPIGYYNSSTDNVIYTGTFDGNGKIISGLYYEDDSKMYIGLFGYSSGTIKNVGVIDTYFHCNSDLGGICGYNLGTVSLCYSKSYLYGKTYNVGGVCGVNYINATITNCYHIGTIYDWEPQVGGVCGYNYGGNISYCYHIGNLENANKSNSGGVCGKNTGTITKCYYDKDKCSVGGINRADAAGQAEGKTTAQFSSGEMAMVLQGSQSGTVWGQTIGSGSYPVIGGAKVNYGYPVNDCFRGYTNLDVTATPNHASFSNGFCSRCNGYQMPKKVSSTHHSDLNATHNGYYAIENAGHFYWFAALIDGKIEYMPKDAAANAVLTTNITVNSNVLKSDGSLNTDNSDSFRVMPIIVTNYSGTFDGNGYTIGGLCINDINFKGVYLFDKITKNGKIMNLGIVDSYMKIGMSCGWFCGRNEGLIINCYNKSTVIANDDEALSAAFGICGENFGRIERCYNTGSISAYGSAAGLCTNNYGVVVNCYNTGDTQSELDWGYTSGLVCGNAPTGSIANCYCAGSKIIGPNSLGSICSLNEGKITNCYYDKDKCSVGGIGGSDVAGQAEGKTTAQFKSGEVTYLLQGDQSEAVWGQTIGTEDYPVLGGKKVNYGYPKGSCILGYTNLSIISAPYHTYNNGFCVRCSGYQPAQSVSNTHHPELLSKYANYYAIENAGQLYWFANRVNEDKKYDICAVLTSNITVNSSVLQSDGTLNSSKQSTFKAWTPIGNSQTNTYSGTFDGNGKTISGLYLNDASKDYVSLFGVSYGTIKNVGVVDTYFHGKSYLGAICGYNIGTVMSCFSKSYIYGANINVGGVCGANVNNLASITNCYHIGTIYDWEPNVGGICGYNFSGKISNCYHSGNIEHANTSNSGGVCGNNTGTITNCYYDKTICTKAGINGADASGKAEGKTTVQFSSGEVTCLLQGSQSAAVWGQTLGTDVYPIIGGKKVYYGYSPSNCEDKKLYSNVALDDSPHHYVNGFCANCDVYQPAQKVSKSHYPELVYKNEGFYAIENAGQLYWFANHVNNDKNNYADAVLTADITVNKNVLNANGSLSSNNPNFRTWKSIGYTNGNDALTYYGIFDGNSHFISGLYSFQSSIDNKGFVGHGYGTIKNLGIVDTYFYGHYNVGVICGYLEQGNITNCYAVGYAGGSNYLGGICGFYKEGSITNNYYDNTICKLGGVNRKDVDGQAMGKAPDKFHNGEVAYLLAQGEDFPEWGQRLGVDYYPVASEYKLVRAALKSEDNTYWATFSNRNNDMTLSVPSGRTLKVYNATVKGGTLRLSERNDCQVAVEEGVLLKTDGEYVNAKANEEYTLTPVAYASNNLVATPFEAETIIADAGYTLYRLTYNKVATKEALGFYLGLVKDSNGNVVSSDGSQLTATPGKAYLKVSTAAATIPSMGAAARGFAFPEETTGIFDIVIEGDSFTNISSDADGKLYNLNGQQVATPSKGVYVKRNKKVVIK